MLELERNEVAGKTALVTGAAKRLGYAVSMALAKEGINIIVHFNKSKREADELCEQLKAFGVKVWSIKSDLSNLEECEQLVDLACERAGPIHILINNAAIFSPSKLQDFSIQEVQSNLLVNAWAPLLLSRAFVRRLGKGHIINFLDSKIAGYSWKHVAYYLSKQMLSILTRMMALQWAPDVRVNAIAPGLILPPEGKKPKDLESLKNTVPLRRIGDPSDISEAVIFLVKSRYITGQILFIDGGWNLQENPSFLKY